MWQLINDDDENSLTLSIHKFERHSSEFVSDGAVVTFHVNCNFRHTARLSHWNYLCLNEKKRLTRPLSVTSRYSTLRVKSPNLFAIRVCLFLGKEIVKRSKNATTYRENIGFCEK